MQLNSGMLISRTRDSAKKAFLRVLRFRGFRGACVRLAIFFTLAATETRCKLPRVAREIFRRRRRRGDGGARDETAIWSGAHLI